MKDMAGRKRHSAEDIVRKLRRADELAAEGKTGEQIANELGVPAATLYKLAPLLRRYGHRRGQRAQGVTWSRTTAWAVAGRCGVEADGQGDCEGKILARPAKRAAIDMLKEVKSSPQSVWRARWLGFPAQAYRRLPRPDPGRPGFWFAG